MKLASTLLCLALLAPSAAAVAQSNDTQPMTVHTYRLNYTVTEFDGTKKIGVQHFSLTAVPGKIATLKMGSKVPVVGGPQGSYYDLGTNIDTRIAEMTNGIQVQVSMDQSSIGDVADIKGSSAAVIRQSRLDNSALVVPGKSVQLGSLDFPGSTRHFELEVVLERLP